MISDKLAISAASASAIALRLKLRNVNNCIINDLIHIGIPIPMDTDVFLIQLKELMKAAYENDEAIRDAVAAMVPTYHPAVAGSAAKGATYDALLREAEMVR